MSSQQPLNCVTKWFHGSHQMRWTHYAIVRDRERTSEKKRIRGNMAGVIQCLWAVSHRTIFWTENMLNWARQTIWQLLWYNLSMPITSNIRIPLIIKINARIKQNCPFSTIIFNLAMEPVLRSITQIYYRYMIDHVILCSIDNRIDNRPFAHYIFW